MRKYKSGLHKDVHTIFGGVWNPDTDNIQQPIDASAANSVAQLNPGPQLIGSSPAASKSVGFLRACKDASDYLFRSKARRERKRLLAISRHLMINMPS